MTPRLLTSRERLHVNSLFDLLHHVVDHIGGWASDEAKAEAHKLIDEHAQQAAALVSGLVADAAEPGPTATGGPGPSPSSPADGAGPDGGPF